MKIKVRHLKGFYNVWIFNEHLESTLRNEKWIKNSNVFLVIDSNVLKYHFKYIKNSLTGYCKIVGIYIFNAKEKNKSLLKVTDIYSALLKTGCDRNTIIFSIGGGITGDIASFTASTYMRGLKYVHIPTTLLSMVDSSIGGKTGVNFSNYKNFIGTFYQPAAVLIDSRFLSTLQVSEFYSGLGEIVKYSLLIDSSQKTILDKRISGLQKVNFHGIENVIYKCIRFKASVVETDEEEESGVRKILNLGHTFAHAIESSSGFKVKHGQAVLLGIICSLFYSYNAKLISAELLYKFLLRIKPFTLIVKEVLNRIDKDSIADSMVMDKKNKNGRVNLVLLAGEGKIVIDYTAKTNLIYKSIDEMLVWVKESFKKETVEK